MKSQTSHCLQTVDKSKMQTERVERLDTVTLPDGSIGRVVEVFVATQSRVYKIQRVDTDEIIYFDETKVTLKRRHFRNVLSKLLPGLS